VTVGGGADTIDMHRCFPPRAAGRSNDRRAAYAGWAAAAFIAFSLAFYCVQFPARFADFRAFYCAGQTLRAGADPYREHPLHECEHALRAPELSFIDAEITVPAPFPGCILGLFAVLSLLPFSVAIALCTLVSVVALLAAIGLIARITAAPPLAVAVVTLFPALVVPLPLGQPTPLALLAIAGCGALLCAGRPRFAALAVFGTAFDPHVALAAGLGLFAAEPRARPVVLGGATLFVAVGLLVNGPAREWEYASVVIPAHALANVPEFSQFSTANLAFMAGVPAALALRIGNLWYAVSLVLGTFVALRLRPTLGPAATAFVPPAFAVFGGAHTHFQQLALAIPAFVLAASAASARPRALLVATTFVAAMPWLLLAPFPILFVPLAVAGVVFARAMRAGAISIALGLCSFWLALGLCCAVAYSARRYVPFAPIAHGNPLAEVAWSRFVARGAPPELWVVLSKGPTIAAFLVVLALLVRMSLTAPPRAHAQ
jgi:hypothetical protein